MLQILHHDHHHQKHLHRICIWTQDDMSRISQLACASCWRSCCFCLACSVWALQQLGPLAFHPALVAEERIALIQRFSSDMPIPERNSWMLQILKKKDSGKIWQENTWRFQWRRTGVTILFLKHFEPRISQIYQLAPGPVWTWQKIK